MERIEPDFFLEPAMHRHCTGALLASTTAENISAVRDRNDFASMSSWTRLETGKRRLRKRSRSMRDRTFRLPPSPPQYPGLLPQHASILAGATGATENLR